MELYFTGIAVIVLSAIISLVIKNQNIKLKLISTGAVIASIFTIISSIKAFLGETLSYTFHFGSVFQNITFGIDKLSAFFVVFISIMTTLAIIYSNGYLKPYIEKGKDLSAHCVFLSILMMSMLGVVTVQNALAFLVIWELMSLSSFFLVIFEHEKKETISAGIKYLVYMHVSVIFIILMFVVLSVASSSLDFAFFKSALDNNTSLANLVFVFGFIGFGIKAGFVPFHNWLPAAHPAAPSHVSGVMSGVMIKTGIYGILRVLTFISEPSVQIGYFVLIVSVVSALYGVLYALGQQDIKKLLAYCSIENIGIIGIGMGIGILGLAYNNSVVAALGFIGCVLHVLNHSIFKELLFLAAGTVYFKTHTRNMEVLGGLIKKMPHSAILFLIAAVAICGLPPFNGFISEFLIYFGMLNGLMIDNILVLIMMIFALAGLALVGTMAILCFTKAFSIIFLGEARSENASKVEKDGTISFIFPMVVLSIFIFAIGLFPKQVLNFMLLPLEAFKIDVQLDNVSYLMQIISLVSASLIFVVAILYGIKRAVYSKTEKYVTWGCGYNKPTSKMQYSASSYASPFITMLKPLFKRVIDVKKPKAIFEKDAHYSLHLEDIEEAYFLTPLIKSTEKFFQRFERIQNGNIQTYIMYGLFFLVAAVVGVIILG